MVGRRCESCESMTWGKGWPSSCDTCGAPLGSRVAVRKPAHVVVRDWDLFHNGLNCRVKSKRDALNKAGERGMKLEFNGV